jgi:hypothetical protein
MLPSPLFTLANAFHHFLSSGFVSGARKPFGQVHIEQPRAESLKVWVTVNPQPFWPLQSLFGLVKGVEPLSRRNELVSTLAEHLGGDLTCSRVQLFAQSSHFGLGAIQLSAKVSIGHELGGRDNSQY